MSCLRQVMLTLNIQGDFETAIQSWAPKLFCKNKPSLTLLVKLILCTPHNGNSRWLIKTGEAARKMYKLTARKSIQRTLSSRSPPTSIILNWMSSNTNSYSAAWQRYKMARAVDCLRMTPMVLFLTRMMSSVIGR